MENSGCFNRGKPDPTSPPQTRLAWEPCGEPSELRRDDFGRIAGSHVAHVSCTRCSHDWWEIDRQPVPFENVSKLLAAHYDKITRRP